MDEETKQNWMAAGLIAGEGFADEIQKMASVYLLGKGAQTGVLDKEAVHGLLRRIAKAPALRRIAIPGLALAGGGAGGAIVAQKTEREKSQAQMAAMAPRIFRAGFMRGAREGLQRGIRVGYSHAKGERAAG